MSKADAMDIAMFLDDKLLKKFRNAPVPVRCGGLIILATMHLTNSIGGECRLNTRGEIECYQRLRDRILEAFDRTLREYKERN